MTERAWIDVGTLAVARLALGNCVPSFVEHLSDRGDYRLRWICHLDQYGLGGLEKDWERQLNEIVDVSALFDDFVLIANRSHVGYGGGFLRILRESRHWLLYTDDDQLFTKDIEIAGPLASGLDYWSWHNSLPGSTTPGLWSPRLVEYYRNTYPVKPRAVTERCLQAMFPKAWGTSNWDQALSGDRSFWPSINSGRGSTRGKAAKFGPHACWVDEQGVVQRTGRRYALEVAEGKRV